jgi:hypothetical protein
LFQITSPVIQCVKIAISLKGNTNQVIQMERANKSNPTNPANQQLARTGAEKRPDLLSDPQLSERCEASEYYGNKIRLIAKLIEKHNAKKEGEQFLREQQQAQVNDSS